MTNSSKNLNKWLEKHNECRSTGSVMLWGAFCWQGLGPLVPLEGRVTSNQYKVVLNDHLYPMMKYFCPDGSGLFQDDNAPIHRARGVSEWFDEYENSSELHVKKNLSISPKLIMPYYDTEYIWYGRVWFSENIFPVLFCYTYHCIITSDSK